MLRAPPLGHPLQKYTVVQWDMGALFEFITLIGGGVAALGERARVTAARFGTEKALEVAVPTR